MRLEGQKKYFTLFTYDLLVLMKLRGIIIELNENFTISIYTKI